VYWADVDADALAALAAARQLPAMMGERCLMTEMVGDWRQKASKNAGACREMRCLNLYRI